MADKIQRWLLNFNRNTYLCCWQKSKHPYTMAKAVNIARSHRLDGIGEYYFSRRLREIAEIKMADLSARDVEAGMKIIAGTARSMGITVTD